MNKYNFTVNKLVTSFSKVDIEANSIEEASEIARLQAEEDHRRLQWPGDRQPHGEPECLEEVGGGRGRVA